MTTEVDSEVAHLSGLVEIAVREIDRLNEETDYLRRQLTVEAAAHEVVVADLHAEITQLRVALAQVVRAVRQLASTGEPQPFVDLDPTKR